MAQLLTGGLGTSMYPGEGTSGTAVPLMPDPSTVELRDRAIRAVLVEIASRARRHDHVAVSHLSAALTALKDA